LYYGVMAVVNLKNAVLRGSYVRTIRTPFLAERWGFVFEGMADTHEMLAREAGVSS